MEESTKLVDESTEALWYVVHTYSGYENKVANDLQTMVENRHLQDLICDIKVPVEMVPEIDKNGKQKMVEHKLFPGYVLVKMVMNDDTWYVVRNTRGCTGFVGPASKPVPLSAEEVEKMGVEKAAPLTVDFNVGDTVQITAGPLEGFMGLVEAIDTENFKKVVKESIEGFKSEIDMTAEDCYVKPKYTSKSEEVKKACDDMNKYLKASITYNFGSNTEVVDKDLISQWVTVDDNMAVTFNSDAVVKYVQQLESKYDTYQTKRTFTTGGGNSATVEGGDYGWIIDEAAEIAALEANIRNGETVTREANYSQTAASHDGADWGNTYVEVDLTNQYLYLFVNGAIVTQGPIVTGKPSRGDATPQGVYILKYKEKDTTLRGPKKEDGSYEWESPVTYWMPFNGGIGLHDANWRKTFGGTIYKTNGSHGCVNTPLDAVATIYNNIEINTPIVVY